MSVATRLKEQARRSSRGQDTVVAVRGQKRNSLKRRLETGTRKEDKTFSSLMLEKNTQARDRDTLFDCSRGFVRGSSRTFRETGDTPTVPSSAVEVVATRGSWTRAFFVCTRKKSLFLGVGPIDASRGPQVMSRHRFSHYARRRAPRAEVRAARRGTPGPDLVPELCSRALGQGPAWQAAPPSEN